MSALAATLAFAVVSASAQNVLLATAATTTDTSPANDQPAVELNPPLPEASPGSETLASTPRRFHYAISVGVREIYDDNINNSSVVRVADFVTTIEPRVMLGLGDIQARRDNYLRLDYDPSISFYADHDEANAVQHLVHLEGQYQLSRLTLNLSQDIQILNGTNLDIATATGTVTDRANVDVGGRSMVDIFTSRLSASYYLAGKTFLSSQLGAAFYQYPSLISSEAFFGNIYLNYIYSSKLTFGLGGGGGYNLVEGPTPDQTFESVSGRVSYLLSEKVKLEASAGAEFRQSADNGATYISPIVQLTATYLPFDGTAVTLDGTIHNTNSAVLAGQDYSTSEITFSIRQRLFRRFSLGLSAGFEHSSYFFAQNGTDAGRTDDYWFLQPSIDITITRFWTAGLYYLHREDNSSFASNSFYDNQIGFRTSLTF